MYKRAISDGTLFSTPEGEAIMKDFLNLTIIMVRSRCAIKHWLRAAFAGSTVHKDNYDTRYGTVLTMLLILIWKEFYMFCIFNNARDFVSIFYSNKQ